MSLNTSHIVPARREEVWAWHSRPGAVARLNPPFYPFTPITQTTDLAKGTTVFALPAGLKWEARHDLSGYVKGFRFTDVCVSAPIRALATWRHSHSFMSIEVNGVPATKVTDEVHTRLPQSSLAPMFAYRQQQLIHDMAAMQRFQQFSDRPLTVAITGSRGLVGRALTAQLTTLGHKVIQLVRTTPKKRQRRWDPQSPAADLLAGVDVLVHLAGEPIMGRFTDAHKQALWDSRVGPTAKLAELVAKSPQCDTMISASAIGVYSFNRGDEILTESSEAGEGFLAELSQAWEADCEAAVSAGKRVVNLRTGVVMSGRGGMLPLLRTLFSTGLGGQFHDGTAWFSWIALDDLTDIIITAAVNSSLSGPINAVSPNPIHNSEMVRTLGKQLHRPARFPIPNLGPRILLGSQGAEEFVLADQRVLPAALLKRGHVFRYRRFATAVAHELGYERLFDAPEVDIAAMPLPEVESESAPSRWWRFPGFGRD